jgi:hypothetical protein
VAQEDQQSSPSLLDLLLQVCLFLLLVTSENTREEEKEADSEIILKTLDLRYISRHLFISRGKNINMSTDACYVFLFEAKSKHWEEEMSCLGKLLQQLNRKYQQKVYILLHKMDLVESAQKPEVHLH